MVKRKRGYSRRSTRRVVRKRGYRRGGRRFRRRASRTSKTWVRTVTNSDATFVKLKFTEPPTIATLGVPGFTTDTYRGNSAYDPDLSAGGTSVEGLNYYSQVYGRYVVLGSKITTQFFNLSTYVRTVGIIPTTDSSSLTAAASYNALQSQPYVRRKVLGPVSSSRSCCTISSYMNTRKILGVPSPTGLEYLWAATNANPSTLWYWFLFIHQNDGNALQVEYQTTVTMYIKFFDRVNYKGN